MLARCKYQMKIADRVAKEVVRVIVNPMNVVIERPQATNEQKASACASDDMY